MRSRSVLYFVDIDPERRHPERLQADPTNLTRITLSLLTLTTSEYVPRPSVAQRRRQVSRRVHLPQDATERGGQFSVQERRCWDSPS